MRLPRGFRAPLRVNFFLQEDPTMTRISLSLKRLRRFAGRSLIAILCVFFTLISAACGETENSAPVYKGKKVDFPTSELAKYTITRPDVCGEDSITAAVELRKALEKVTAINLTTDFVNERRGETVPEDNLEILVGATNRADSVSLTADLRYDEFIVAKTEKHIVVAGGSESATLDAVNFFIENFVTEKGVSLPENDYVYRYKYAVDAFTLNGRDITEYTVTASSSIGIYLPERVAHTLRALTGRTISTGSTAVETPQIRFELTDELPADTCAVASDGKNIFLRGADNDALLIAAKEFFVNVVKADMKKASAKLDISVPADKPLEFNCAELLNAEPEVYSVTPKDLEDENYFDALFSKISGNSLLTLSPQVIEFAGGDYSFTKPITLDSFSSGTKYSPLTLRAAEGADVRFLGGEAIDYSKAVAVTDESVLSRLADQSVRGKLMQLDMTGLGMESPFYNGSGKSNNTPAVYIDETPLTRSRFPNKVSGKGYLRTGEELEYEDWKNGPITFNYVDETDHAKKYWSEKTLKDLYVFGFLAWDWHNDQTKVKSLDFDSKVVTLWSGTTYEPNPKSRFYFYNLLEEIDVPGESFYDSETQILYFYPYEGGAKEIWLSTYDKNFIKLNGASNVVIDGISFLYTRTRAVDGTELSNVTIKNCTVAHSSADAIKLSGTKLTVDGCKVYDTCYGGITIAGGDRAGLISGESVVKNCEIHDVNRSEATYQPGISAQSVGLQILNNKLWGNTHEMIAAGTNDVVIKYNEIFECVTESADMGSIYFGRNPTVLGVEIAYNYFHHIGNEYGGVGQQAIFCDDGSMGPWVHDNVFYKATYDTAAYKAHAAQYTLVENNIFLDMPAAFQNASWEDKGATTQSRWCEYYYGELWERMEAVPFESELWHEHYDGTIWANVWKHLSSEVEKEVIENFNDEKKLAEIYKKYAPDTTNILRDNVYYNITEMEKNKGKIWYGGALIDENNVALEKSDFVDYDGGNFALTDEALAKVRKTIPDFRNIDMTKIGPGAE